MWENTLIESKGLVRRKKYWWSIPAAAALHGGLIAFAVLSSYWHVEAMEGAPARLTYIDVLPVSLSPPPARGGGGSKAANVSMQKPEKVIQPTEVPPLNEVVDNTTDFAPGQETGDSTMEGPEGEGVPYGVVGGWGTIPEGTGFGIPGDENEPRILTANITPPALIRRVEPSYPHVAARLRISGMVVLEAVISKEGDVENLRILRSDNALLEAAAKEAVLKWKYKPALLNGRPVKVYFTVTCKFHLK